MSSLNGSWIEIFRAGDYGDRGVWSAQDLDGIAAGYNPRLHPAPVVVGHPKDDAPAYGWIARLRRAGQSLWAQLEKVDAGFEKLLREGRFRQRSVALYKKFPPTGEPYLRHVGFLGAQAPAVKGLAPVRFADAPQLEFTETLSETKMESSVGQTFLPASAGLSADSKPQAGTLRLRSGRVPAPSSPKSIPEAVMSQTKLETFLDHLRAFFSGGDKNSATSSAPAEEKGEPSAPPAPSSPPANGSGLPVDLSAAAFRPRLQAEVLAKAEALAKAGSGEEAALVDSSPAVVFAERLGRLEQRLEVLANQKSAAERKLAETKNSAHDTAVANFVETLRARGQFPPAFERMGVVDFMQRLVTANTAFTEQAGLPTIARRAKAGSVDEDPRSGNSSTAVPESLLSWFQEFLAQLPRVIEFRELASHNSAGRSPSQPAGQVVRFAAPKRGVEVDPASVELAERAEALAAGEAITYAEALAQLRQQQRQTPNSA